LMKKIRSVLKDNTTYYCEERTLRIWQAKLFRHHESSGPLLQHSKTTLSTSQGLVQQ
jgi:hypothetical protein